MKVLLSASGALTPSHPQAHGETSRRLGARGAEVQKDGHTVGSQPCLVHRGLAPKPVPAWLTLKLTSQAEASKSEPWATRIYTSRYQARSRAQLSPAFFREGDRLKEAGSS